MLSMPILAEVAGQTDRASPPTPAEGGGTFRCRRAWESHAALNCMPLTYGCIEDVCKLQCHAAATIPCSKRSQGLPKSWKGGEDSLLELVASSCAASIPGPPWKERIRARSME